MLTNGSGWYNENMNGCWTSDTDFANNDVHESHLYGSDDSV